MLSRKATFLLTPVLLGLVIAIFTLLSLNRVAAGFFGSASGEEDVDQVAAQFHNFYTSVINDLVSYMDNPDYARAEQQRQEMVDHANQLIGELEGQAEGLKAEMAVLRKDLDLQNVGDALVEYSNANSGAKATTGAEPTAAIADVDADGTIRVFLNSSAADPTDIPGNLDATCGDGTGTISDAVAQCFGTIDFAKLVPDYLTVNPSHSDTSVSITQVDGADLTIIGFDAANHVLELYTDADVSMMAWVALADNTPGVLVSDAQYSPGI